MALCIRTNIHDSEGTNGATVESMKGVKGVNSLSRRLLSVLEVPVFAAAVLAILITGEMNFFSEQVRCQTAPIASTGLAALGSPYLLLSSNQPDVDENGNAVGNHLDCSTHNVSGLSRHFSHNSPLQVSVAVHPKTDEEGLQKSKSSPPPVVTPSDRGPKPDTGNSTKVANVLTNIANYIGTAAQDRFNDFEFKHGTAVGHPELPGESYKKLGLVLIRKK
ncbi:hypothetical protein VTL71DRAFT_2048 [Oculimacula yallundae]|uniref:Uncharacterized protein n=1 Tax=Oculimacula yallundae TaxID=86028 RepID=A0ABR4C7S2_9HELO